MPFSLRVAFLLFFGILCTARLSAQVVNPPRAAPAFLDVVAFEFHADGENHKVVVTTGSKLVRVDEPEDGYSVVYNPQTETYTGLEHRNYTYWEFSWPQIRAEVENSKRYETRLQQLGNEGINADPVPPSTNAPSDASSSAGSDDSGYVWHPTTERKRIAGLDCIRWTGDTVSGENVEAWCYNGVLPKIQSAVDHLHQINEPMALVPIRTIAPDFIFPIFGALIRGGVTPLLIDWGQDQEKNSFRFVKAETRTNNPSVLLVPKLYVQTTLVTMDGLIDEQPVQPDRKSDAAKKTWQN